MSPMSAIGNNKLNDEKHLFLSMWTTLPVVRNGIPASTPREVITITPRR